MDSDTFEAIARLEARVDALRAAFVGLVAALTYRDRALEMSISAQLQGAWTYATDPHQAFREELKGLKFELDDLIKRRDENDPEQIA